MTIDQGGDNFGDRSGQVAPAPGDSWGCVPRDTPNRRSKKKRYDTPSLGTSSNARSAPHRRLTFFVPPALRTGTSPFSFPKGTISMSISDNDQESSAVDRFSKRPGGQVVQLC